MPAQPSAAEPSAAERQPSAAERPAPTGEEHPFATNDMLADRIVRQNMLWAAGGGLIPVPMLDIVAITAVELKMLKELAVLYDVPFREDQVKSILVSLMAGLGASALGAVISVSLLKSVPILGAVSGYIAVPGAAAAFTYAVGKVFLQHFASGGTFLDFEPKKVREHFARQFEEGKVVAAKTKVEANPKAEASTKPA
jgi:uncharacterized protein (DUF697 family)